MREALVILLVILVLFGMTAVRYRKQIAGILGFARLLKEAKNNLGQSDKAIRGETTKSIALVNCSQCGVWVPQNKARKVGDIFYCSDKCVQTAR